MSELTTIFDNGTHKIETSGVVAADNRTAYQLVEIAARVSGSAAQIALSGDYVADIGEPIEVVAILDDGSSITYPDAVIKMPVVRHANGLPTDDEIYFNATIIDGVMTATGSLPRSGDWKILSERVNSALLRVGADWKVKQATVTFLV